MEICHDVMLVSTGTILVVWRFQHKCLLIQLCSGFVPIVFNQSGTLSGFVQSCVSCCHHEICLVLDSTLLEVKVVNKLCKYFAHRHYFGLLTCRVREAT